MNLQQSELFAEERYQAVIKVSDFINVKVNPIWETISLASSRDESIDGLYLRATAWLLSVKKLNSGIDIQPIVSGARSFLEITTDLILIYYDKTNESGWRMKWWEDSAKLKSAQALIQYFTYFAKKPIPDSYQPTVDFVKNKEAEIKFMRKQLGWVNSKNPTKDRHPERWTDRKNLLEDVKKADGLHGAVIERHFGSNLEEFYETEYRRLNWNVHGSGVIGIRGIEKEVINLIRGFGYIWCAKLAMVCTDIILQELKDRGQTGGIDNLIIESEYISVNIVRH